MTCHLELVERSYKRFLDRLGMTESIVIPSEAEGSYKRFLDRLGMTDYFFSGDCL